MVGMIRRTYPFGRVCLDLRPLNNQMDGEPLKIPKIAELLDMQD
jgi:hypothetical protein